ncbi:MAG: cyclase family protein [Clostridia bacterium]|nr:cyclase family protein [Clostridia bacterium]
MKIYDISMEIYHEMAVYENKEEKKPIIGIDSNFSDGCVYESYIKMNLHTGTHMDAPLHMIESGSMIGSYELSRVVTPCKVLDLTMVEDRITAQNLVDRDIKTGDFILFKTRNSFEHQFNNDFIFLDKSGAEYLAKQGVAGVGIDALGIERSQPEHETHKILFGADVVILEGLRLAEAKEGQYLLIAVPLKIKDVEAAPARAILIEQ